MNIIKIKLTGSPEDVTTLTKIIETVMGIEQIDQMSGLIPGEKSLSHRYIDVITSPVKCKVLDKNFNPIIGELVAITPTHDYNNE